MTVTTKELKTALGAIDLLAHENSLHSTRACDHSVFRQLSEYRRIEIHLQYSQVHDEHLVCIVLPARFQR